MREICMKKIKNFIYFFIFFRSGIFGILESYNINYALKDKQIDILNSAKNETLLENDSNRILKILEILYFFEKSFLGNEIKNLIEDFFKVFFGLSINSIINKKNLDRQVFIDNIIMGIINFNQIDSSDLKYLCDMQIKYILNFKYKILKKIKKKSIYSMIILSYYFYLFFPDKYINLNDKEHSDNNIDEIAIKKNDWEEAAVQIPLEFAELGMLQNGYLYKIYDSLVKNQLYLNKNYNNLFLTKNILIDKIQDDEFILEDLIKIYKKNIFIKNDFIMTQLYKNKEDFFIVWLLNKNNITESLEKFFNEDYMFILFTIILIYHSIVKSKKLNFYPFINDNILESFKKIALQAKLIFYKFCNICNIKLKLNWDNMPIIIMKEKRLLEIIAYLNKITIL